MRSISGLAEFQKPMKTIFPRATLCEVIESRYPCAKSGCRAGQISPQATNPLTRGASLWCGPTTVGIWKGVRTMDAKRTHKGIHRVGTAYIHLSHQMPRPRSFREARNQANLPLTLKNFKPIARISNLASLIHQSLDQCCNFLLTEIANRRTNE